MYSTARDLFQSFSLPKPQLLKCIYYIWIFIPPHHLVAFPDLGNPAIVLGYHHSIDSGRLQSLFQNNTTTYYGTCHAPWPQCVQCLARSYSTHNHWCMQTTEQTSVLHIATTSFLPVVSVIGTYRPHFSSDTYIDQKQGRWYQRGLGLYMCPQPLMPVYTQMTTSQDASTGCFYKMHPPPCSLVHSPASTLH